MDQTKITAKIYQPLLMAFTKRVKEVHIKRDAFLNHILKSEVKHLSEEMGNQKLSSEARRYISGELKRMDTVTINVVVDKETADALNSVVKQTNLVRDAFLNRLIMFLLASKSLLKFLELPSVITAVEYSSESFYDDMPTSPLGAIEYILGDPLYYLRLAAKERFDCGLYLLGLPSKFIGMSCYLPTDAVPGTVEYKELEEVFSQMLPTFDDIEKEAFSHIQLKEGAK